MSGSWISALILIGFGCGQWSSTSASPRNRTRIVVNTQEEQLPEINLQALGGAVNGSDCVYRILKGGPDGVELTNVNVGEPVYHQIECRPNGKRKSDNGFCLMVFNCSVSTETKPNAYAMIDDNGCSLEPLLFEDVEYDSDLRAGIRAQAIRFHGSPSVRLDCQTRLLNKGKADCKDRRPKCINNEYFLAANVKVNTPSVRPSRHL